MTKRKHVFIVSESDIEEIINQHNFSVTDEEFSEICKRVSDGLGEVWSDYVEAAVSSVVRKRVYDM